MYITHSNPFDLVNNLPLFFIVETKPARTVLQNVSKKAYLANQKGTIACVCIVGRRIDRFSSKHTFFCVSTLKFDMDVEFMNRKIYVDYHAHAIKLGSYNQATSTKTTTAIATATTAKEGKKKV